MNNLEPTIMLVDGDVHGHYSIDSFIERYIGITKFCREVSCPIDLDDHSFWTDRYNEQFRAYAHEVDECLAAGEVSIIVKGIEWPVQWINGDIIAINPLSDWDDESEAYVVYGDIKKELMDYLLPEQIEEIDESVLPEVEAYFEEGEEEVRAAVLEYCSYDLRQAKDTMEGLNGIHESEERFYQGQIDLLILESEDFREDISVEKYAYYHKDDFIFLPCKDGRVAVFVKA